MDRFGNTSSASVPICLNEMRRNGLLREGQTIVCTGLADYLWRFCAEIVITVHTQKCTIPDIQRNNIWLHFVKTCYNNLID